VSSSSGSLFIVATPIGNLADITYRAVEILKTVDLIAAEDTRHSQHLLTFYGIKTPRISLHEHNEQQRIKQLITLLQEGKQIALISDAGTPLISDPGYRLVAALHQMRIPIVPIPGACAAINALVASGLPTDRFIFEGFLPVKGSVRKQRLQELAEESRTVIFYEAPHRIEDLVNQLITEFGGVRLATVAREITKNFETIHHATLNDLKQWLSDDANQRKGEFVVIVQGKEKKPELQNEEELKRILKILLAELSLKQAVALAVSITHLKRNYVYNIALNLLPIND